VKCQSIQPILVFVNWLQQVRFIHFELKFISLSDSLILVKIRSSYGIVLAAASSGIATTLIDEVKTANSLFKLPLNINVLQSPHVTLINNQLWQKF